MLDPNARSLYTEALRPPPGWQLDRAIASTYSVDLTTLLAFPLHLAVLDAEGGPETLLEDGIALLESIRRTTARLAIFCQHGRIHAPTVPRTLFALLEPVLHEVRLATSVGCLHAKFWLLRFTTPGSEGERDVRLRLVLPTRNITYDHCWDLVLTIDGTPRGRRRAENRELRELLERLPSLAVASSINIPHDALAELADELHRTEWELPDGYEDLWLHVTGGDARLPIPESDRLTVISPFLSDAALQRLASSTNEATALVSRPEFIAALTPETPNLFNHVLVLNETADANDSGDDEPASAPRLGLHAKAYIAEQGAWTHLFVGSANATNAGCFGRNIEILAELVGRRRRVGGIDELLGKDALGAVLVDYIPPDEGVLPGPEQKAAEAALDAARDTLAAARLRVICERQSDGTCAVRMDFGEPLTLVGIVEASTWPVSLSPDRFRADVMRLTRGEAVRWADFDVANVTGLIAFELRAAAAPTAARFVLNLPVEGLDLAERDAAILRGVIRNREGFLRYLLLLLGEEAESLLSSGSSARGGWVTGFDQAALLEELARALHRSPERLQNVRRVVAELSAHSDGDQIVPPEFLELWSVFEQILDEVPA